MDNSIQENTQENTIGRLRPEDVKIDMEVVCEEGFDPDDEGVTERDVGRKATVLTPQGYNKQVGTFTALFEANSKYPSKRVHACKPEHFVPYLPGVKKEKTPTTI